MSSAHPADTPLSEFGPGPSGVPRTKMSFHQRGASRDFINQPPRSSNRKASEGPFRIVNVWKAFKQQSKQVSAKTGHQLSRASMKLEVWIHKHKS